MSTIIRCTSIIISESYWSAYCISFSTQTLLQQTVLIAFSIINFLLTGCRGNTQSNPDCFYESHRPENDRLCFRDSGDYRSGRNGQFKQSRNKRAATGLVDTSATSSRVEERCLSSALHSVMSITTGISSSTRAQPIIPLKRRTYTLEDHLMLSRHYYLLVQSIYHDFHIHLYRSSAALSVSLQVLNTSFSQTFLRNRMVLH